MSKTDERYERGQIYTVRCKYDKELIFVGSTIQTLAVRMGGHRGTNNKKQTSLYLKVDGDWKNWYIELYENYPCNNKQELERREGEVIREIGTVNRCIAGRNLKEYYIDNREILLNKQKLYANNNKEKVRECQNKCYEKNKEYRLVYASKYRLYNNEKIVECKKEKMTCECGCVINKIHIQRHKRTVKHQQLMENLN